MDNGVFDGVQEAAEIAMRQMTEARRDTLDVQFYWEATKNEAKSKTEGRPIFEDVEWVSIRIPGETDVRRRPVKEEDRLRWPEKYKLFKSADSQDKAEGFPLREWTLITEGQRRELAFFGVRTVEQLARLSDSAIQNLGTYMALRQQARDWLQASREGAVLVKLRSENDELRTRLQLLERTVEAQANEIAAARNEGQLPKGDENARLAALEAKLAMLVGMTPLPPPEPPVLVMPKRRGRPPGSKNKPKVPAAEG